MEQTVVVDELIFHVIRVGTVLAFLAQLCLKKSLWIASLSRGERQ
jgi:hypothetical protein